jgi:hypothetical protein
MRKIAELFRDVFREHPEPPETLGAILRSRFDFPHSRYVLPRDECYVRDQRGRQVYVGNICIRMDEGVTHLRIFVSLIFNNRVRKPSNHSISSFLTFTRTLKLVLEHTIAMSVVNIREAMLGVRVWKP